MVLTYPFQCIRVAEEDTRRHLIEEMVNKPQLEKLLKDSYANYVVQTALDFADDIQHQKVCIRSLKVVIKTYRLTFNCISWETVFVLYYQVSVILLIVSVSKVN